MNENSEFCVGTPNYETWIVYISFWQEAKLSAILMVFILRKNLLGLMSINDCRPKFQLISSSYDKLLAFIAHW